MIHGDNIIETLINNLHNKTSNISIKDELYNHILNKRRISRIIVGKGWFKN